ncbi:hypothetical protein EVAR_7018_1 [Eumeta japonica]|uniref:Uncharacterized protein n=1 Tax=Eumeta variegata TaxID=151549 RepID=A0A4C1THT6_EUMVA|nr:hypothetical protein EVAR_7018_1 [Eumeta japonica]
MENKSSAKVRVSNAGLRKRSVVRTVQDRTQVFRAARRTRHHPQQRTIEDVTVKFATRMRASMDYVSIYPRLHPNRKSDQHRNSNHKRDGERHPGSRPGGTEIGNRTKVEIECRTEIKIGT